MALDSRATETLYHGARGPGKTDTQLMRFYRHVGKGYGNFWRGIIFDREYKNLDDLIGKSKRWFAGRGDGAMWHASTSAYRWTWPTGEELLFRAIKAEEDYWNYHGQEFPFIGWNELCKFPTSSLYDKMFSCNRSSFTPEKDGANLVNQDGSPYLIKPISLETFSTANPYGPGHGWVKKRFIDPVPNGKMQRAHVVVFNPATDQDEVVETTRVAIFGSWRENIYLSTQYIAQLMAQKDPNLRKAWLLGDWNIVAGGAFDDVYSPSIHRKPRFRVPAGWRVDRSFDWGSSHPFCCVWWAEANGENASLPDGTTFCPPAGTLIAIDELYGSDDVGNNKGLKWSATKVADAILVRDKQLLADGWVCEEILPGPADNQIRDVREDDVDTIEWKMEQRGVLWEHSDKSPGSRKNGLQLARDRFEAAKDREGAGLYAMENCLIFHSLLPTLPRDQVKMDDVDTEAEDHIWDTVRYRVLKSANRIDMNLKISWAM